MQLFYILSVLSRPFCLIPTLFFKALRTIRDVEQSRRIDRRVIVCRGDSMAVNLRRQVVSVRYIYLFFFSFSYSCGNFFFLSPIFSLAGNISPSDFYRREDFCTADLGDSASLASVAGCRKPPWSHGMFRGESGAYPDLISIVVLLEEDLWWCSMCYYHKGACAYAFSNLTWFYSFIWCVWLECEYLYII